MMSNRRRWIVLLVLCLGQFMVLLDQTVVNVALPTIQHDLNFSQASLAWVINAYLITLGGLLLMAGRLGDLIGPKKVFMSGLTLFTASSAWCGFSQSQAELVAARFIQGIGAAGVSATILGILVTLFPEPREKVTAMGIYACVAVTGGIFGLLLGGVLTQSLSWHWIFFINIPIGGVGLAAGAILIPEQVGSGIRNGVDYLGAALITVATVLLSYAIIEAGTNGWGSVRTLGVGGTAIVLLGSFVALERRVKSPMVPLRTFRSRNLIGASLARALVPFGGIGTPFLASLYVQHVLGYSPINTGLSFLPMFATSALCPVLLTPRLMHRWGAKATLIPGILIVTVGVVLFARVPLHGNYLTDLLPGELLFGVGGGMAFSPLLALSMAGAPPSETGLASGFSNSANQLGGGLAVAFLASIATMQTRHLVAQHTGRISALLGGYHTAWYSSIAFLVGATLVSSLVVQDWSVGRSTRGEKRTSAPILEAETGI